MTNLFRRPYRRTDTPGKKIPFILIFGLFIFLFLFLFRPFGLAELDNGTLFLVCLGFGLVTTLVLIIFTYLIEPVVIRDNWTFGKNIVWDIVIASSIGIANYFYVTTIFSHIFMFKYFLFAIWTALLVGAIPVTISYIYTFNRMYKNALKDAAIVPSEVIWESEVVIRGGNPKNEFKFNPRNIVYLCSNDNYVTIVAISGETLTRTHIRGTLKAVEWELKKNSGFFRCHKCYLVNEEFADRVTGNAQNMKIKLKTQGIEIPVSRSKAPEVIRRFR